MTTITGTPGTSVSASYTGPDFAKPTIASGDVNGPFQGIADDVATLNALKMDVAGGAFSGSVTFDGAVICSATSSVTINAGCPVNVNSTDFDFENGSVVEFKSGSKVSVLGRKALYRSRATIADGNKKIAVASGGGIDYSGDRFNLPTTTGDTRTITLDSTIVVPEEGETLTFFLNTQSPSFTMTSIPTVAFVFKRDDASTAARIYWDPTNVDQNPFDQIWLSFEYTGGAWKLAENSGSVTDDATQTVFTGVRLS